KEAGISSAAKRKLGSFAIEHEMDLIKTSLVILEFNFRYGSRSVRGARTAGRRDRHETDRLFRGISSELQILFVV
ncbi:MAG: hypothetical protein FWG09_05110, partial [Synergistaceae bacterium]|nr:hypothetical protein [Synergistaceae bacterium]